MEESDEPAQKMVKLEAVIDRPDLADLADHLQHVKEEILTEDDNNIVGLISQIDEERDLLEEDLDDLGLPTIDVKVKIEESKGTINTFFMPTRSVKVKEEEIPIDIKTAFTDQEDMALHALDLISPYDINFISSHMPRRTAKDIERRLDDTFFRKKYFLFQKIPSFLFGLTFTNHKHLKFRSLMMISENLVSNLICVRKSCVHGSDIPELSLEYDGTSKLGCDLNVIVEFINENLPPRFRTELRMTAERLEKLFHDSKISFHRYGTSIGHVYTKMKKVVNKKSTIKKEYSPMLVENGILQLSKEHRNTLIKIVSAIGKSRWDMALKLLNETFGKTRAPLWIDAKIQHELSEVYLRDLDPGRSMGEFSNEEDKCLLFLHKQFYQTCLGNMPQVWRSIARHMPGRSEEDCKNRLLRKSTSKEDLTLDNLDLEELHDDVPSLYYYNNCHVFALTVIPKNERPDMDVPTKLQHECRFLVAGTQDEIFILPCKETALRCSHQGFSTMNFTYNPNKPDSQFETYLKLTFANQLKRNGLIDEEQAKTFNFTHINYAGRGIHAIISELENTRFVVPKEYFMMINEMEDMKMTGGKRGFCNEKIYKDEEQATN